MAQRKKTEEERLAYNEKRRAQYAEKGRTETKEQVLAANERRRIKRATDAEYRRELNQRRKDKLASDPEYHEQIKAKARAKHQCKKNDPEYVKKRRGTPEQKAELNRRRKERYHTDPEYRAKVQTRNRVEGKTPKYKETRRVNRERKKERVNAERRLRYALDEEYRDKKLKKEADKREVKRKTRDTRYFIKLMWESARRRAGEKNLPFTITEQDITIPDTCPVLGIELVPGVGRPIDSSPTLDRIVPSSGYTPSNIHVISYKANCLKSYGQMEDLVKIGQWAAECLKKSVDK